MWHSRVHSCGFQGAPRPVSHRTIHVVHPVLTRGLCPMPGRPRVWCRASPQAQLVNAADFEGQLQDLQALLEQTLQEEAAAKARRRDLELRLTQLKARSPTEPLVAPSTTPTSDQADAPGNTNRQNVERLQSTDVTPLDNARVLYVPGNTNRPPTTAEQLGSTDGTTLDTAASQLPGSSTLAASISAPNSGATNPYDSFSTGDGRSAAAEVTQNGSIINPYDSFSAADGRNATAEVKLNGSITNPYDSFSTSDGVSTSTKVVSTVDSSTGTLPISTPEAANTAEAAITDESRSKESSFGSAARTESESPVSVASAEGSRVVSQDRWQSTSSSSAQGGPKLQTSSSSSSAPTSSKLQASSSSASAQDSPALQTSSSSFPAPNNPTLQTSSSSSPAPNKPTLQTPSSSSSAQDTPKNQPSSSSPSKSTSSATSSSASVSTPVNLTPPKPAPKPPIEGMYSVRLPARSRTQSAEPEKGVWGGVLGYMGDADQFGSTPPTPEPKLTGTRMGAPKLATASQPPIPTGPTTKRKIKKKSKKYEAMAAAAGANKVTPTTPPLPSSSAGPLSRTSSPSRLSPFSTPNLQDSLDQIADKMGDLVAAMDSSFDLGEQMWVSPWDPKNKQADGMESCTIPKPIYIISDCTGESAARTVKAALGQFEGFSKRSCPANLVVFRFVNSERNAMRIIEHAQREDALVVYTLVDTKLVKTVATSAKLCGVKCVDLWSPLLTAMEEHLDTVRSGLPLGDPDRKSVTLSDDYFRMIEAVEFTRKMDDGANPQRWKDADLLILGVSRSGKTPLSIYLGQRGYKVANLPLVPNCPLPKELFEIDQSRIIALVIDAQLLAKVRKQRNMAMGVGEDSNTDYAAVRKVQAELDWARTLYGEHPEWPVLDVTFRGVEETAARILRIMAERRGNVSPMWVQEYNREMIGVLH